MDNFAGMKAIGELLSIHEAGRLIGRSGQMVNLYCRAEGLPHRRVGGRIIILKDDLLEWASRPEILDMFSRGEERKRRRVNQLATA